MLQIAFLIAFIIQFLHACTWEGMIFRGIAERLWTLPIWIKKPLFGCPICMTPWWGALTLITAHNTGVIDITGTNLQIVVKVIFTLFVAAGINTVFIKMFSIDEAESEE